MSRVRPYTDLTPAEREQLFAFTARHDPERYPDYESMERAYNSIAFDHGETQFTCWQGDALVGAMGAVTREATVRGEVFITAVAVEPEAEGAFAALFERTVACIPPLDGLVVRMGISPSHGHLEAHVATSGFALEYDGLIMAREAGALAITPLDGWRIETVSEANREDYRRVLDSAFRHSPNGASISEEQVIELMSEVAHADLLGVAYWNDEPVAAYELCLQESIGWIESVAVAPWMQGKGIGKHIVRDAMARLVAYDVSHIKLLVMSSNGAAVRLYENCGFRIESVTSRWWRLDAPISAEMRGGSRT